MFHTYNIFVKTLEIIVFLYTKEEIQEIRRQ